MAVTRNVLDAMCWRPQMRRAITRTTVPREIRFISVLRNEMQRKLSPRAVKATRCNEHKEVDYCSVPRGASRTTRRSWT